MQVLEKLAATPAQTVARNVNAVGWMQRMPSIDSAVIAEYTSLAIPADRIVADPQVAARFCDAVNRRLPAEHQVDQATLNQRLLNLRRRSEDNGGLPRLGRNYLYRSLPAARSRSRNIPGVRIDRP